VSFARVWRIKEAMELVHNFLSEYSVHIAVVVGIGFLYYKFGGGFGRKSRENYSILVGDKPRGASKIIRNYRCEKTGLLTSYEGCATIYQTFQYSLFLRLLLICRNTLKRYPNQRHLGTRTLIKIHKEETVVRDEKKTWLFYELGPYQWYHFL
jgi:hypothetical protein